MLFRPSSRVRSPANSSAPEVRNIDTALRLEPLRSGYQHVVRTLTSGYMDTREFARRHRRRAAYTASALALTACVTGVVEGVLSIKDNDRIAQSFALEPGPVAATLGETPDPSLTPNAELYSRLNPRAIWEASKRSAKADMVALYGIENSALALIGYSAVAYRRRQLQHESLIGTAAPNEGSPTNELEALQAMFNDASMPAEPLRLPNALPLPSPA